MRLARFVLRFLRQSVVAGIDVAWRALDPRLPLRPGFVVYQPRLPPGPARNAFCTMTSLLPGTLPCRSRCERRSRHPLSRCKPAGGGAIGAEEALLIDALGGRPSDG